MTTMTVSNWVTQVADERRGSLDLLAKIANRSHRWAVATASAAMAHVVAAGNALIHARELCDKGGWLRWLRKNFDGSVRTAQRYMRVARHLPDAVDATQMPYRTQTALLRAIRGAVFGELQKRKVAAPPAQSHNDPSADNPEARRRLSFSAARRLRKLAGTVAAMAGGEHAAELAERIKALAADLLLDVGEGSGGQCGGSERGATAGEVYFIEAVGADRVKIGVSQDVAKRFGQLAASFPGPLVLLGKVAGGRAREKSLHRRLANFRIGGEWFHLTPGVRQALREVIDDRPD